jgi:hypothetical protein
MNQSETIVVSLALVLVFAPPKLRIEVPARFDGLQEMPIAELGPSSGSVTLAGPQEPMKLFL